MAASPRCGGSAALMGGTPPVHQPPRKRDRRQGVDRLAGQQPRLGLGDEGRELLALVLVEPAGPARPRRTSASTRRRSCGVRRWKWSRVRTATSAAARSLSTGRRLTPGALAAARAAVRARSGGGHNVESRGRRRRGRDQTPPDGAYTGCCSEPQKAQRRAWRGISLRHSVHGPGLGLDIGLGAAGGA